METDDASNVRHLFARHPEVMSGEMPDRWEGIGGKVEAVHKFDAFKLFVSWAFRERFHTPNSSLLLPSLLSTEIVSNDLHRPFHYRLGLHQVIPDLPSICLRSDDCRSWTSFPMRQMLNMRAIMPSIFKEALDWMVLSHCCSRQG